MEAMNAHTLNLDGKSDADLIKLLKNANRRTYDPRSGVLKKRIFTVFEQRSAQFIRRNRGAELAASGILSAFGYRVGHDGIRDPQIRQQILDLIYTAELPPVLDPNYIREWGSPESPQRKAKLTRVLSSFIRSCKRRTTNKLSYRLALSHWESDLAYFSAT
jgi:hypothetical protein